MGTRGNIKMKQQDGSQMYFYQHSDAYDLPGTLQAALKRGKSRWTDEIYLGRIIFSEMIQGAVLSETGYGLSTYLGDGDNRITEVDCAAQTVSHNGKTWSFTDFCKLSAEALDEA